ncbi:hypothetical protein C0Q70_09231 [Pomacea canaliculata]|uniref:Uncharacterized protein n=1 Tax=Pomacea canaliculata TaxID=400727 RepID=A0A2T7P975_POMCA|nr:hypothetical protein C0Q70_09231 [Pomacea canaliculata]
MRNPSNELDNMQVRLFTRSAAKKETGRRFTCPGACCLASACTCEYVLGWSTLVRQGGGSADARDRMGEKPVTDCGSVNNVDTVSGGSHDLAARGTADNRASSPRTTLSSVRLRAQAGVRTVVF